MLLLLHESLTLVLGGSNARMLVVPASRVRERLINAHACCLLGRGRALLASCE